MVSWNHPSRWSPERRKREMRRWWRNATWRDRLGYIVILVCVAAPVWLLGMTMYWTRTLLEKLHLRKPVELPPYFQ